jgi:hypothetical protein
MASSNDRNRVRLRKLDFFMASRVFMSVPHLPIATTSFCGFHQPISNEQPAS